MVETTAATRGWILWRGMRDFLRRYPDPMRAGLPEVRRELRDVHVDRAALREFNSVCGFRDSANLPFTYPHILAFKTQMRIMMSSEFPMAVTGMLHLSNVTRQYRPIGVGDHFDLHVWADNLSAHRKGVTVDLRTEARLAGEVVWSETSTYLRLLPKSGPRPPKKGGSEEPELESDREWFVPARLGRDYAAVSGDYNPIHVSRTMARMMGNKDLIAQGMWGLSRAVAEVEPTGSMEDRKVEVEFRRPIVLRQKIGFYGDSTEYRDDFALVRLADGKAYLRGRVEFDLG